VSKGRKRSLLALTLVVVAGAVASTAIVMNRADAHNNSRADDPGLVVPSSTTPPTTVRRVTTATTEPLPIPQSSPSDPYANVPVVQIGTIDIPKIHLLHPIFEGVTLTVIDHGPGHWPGSAMPGHRGNTVFPGHRVTHTHPFLDLDLLAPGDQVIFHMPDGTFTYAVTGTQIVKPTDMWVLDQTTQPTFTLIACHPKHSAAQRIVVKGKLVASIPSAAAVSGARDVAQRSASVGI
jgi:sortase A